MLGPVRAKSRSRGSNLRSQEDYAQKNTWPRPSGPFGTVENLGSCLQAFLSMTMKSCGAPAACRHRQLSPSSLTSRKIAVSPIDQGSGSQGAMSEMACFDSYLQICWVWT